MSDPSPDKSIDLAQLEALKSQIHEESRIQSWGRRPTLVVDVQIPSHEGAWSSRRSGRSVTVTVSVSDGALRVHDDRTRKTMPLASAEQLVNLLADIRERLFAQDKERQRRDKIRKLKERAIETQIDAIASRFGLAYALRFMVHKAKLTVRLDEQNGVAIDIPYKQLHEVLTELPRMLEILRDVYRSGARFKVIPIDRIMSFREPKPAAPGATAEEKP